MARPRPLQVALFGDTSLLLYCAEVLLARGHGIRLVVASPTGTRRWAARHGLPACVDETEAMALLPDGLDLLVDAGHPTVLAPSLVARARQAVRFHAGPLPEYSGFHVTTWALLAGEAQHGICWHTLVGRGHGGPVLARTHFSVTDRDTTADLDARCLAAAVASFPTLLENLEEGRLKPEPQPDHRRQWFGQHRTPPGAGALDWRRPAGVLDRTVRALSGGAQSPVAWATMAVGREAVVVEQARVEARDQAVPPGTVLAHDPHSITVAAGAGALHITRIWRQDGRPLRFSDLPVSIGEILPAPDVTALEALDQQWRPDAEVWARRLGEARPVGLPWGEAGAPEAGGRLSRMARDEGQVLAAACVLLARAAGTFQFDVAVTDPVRQAAVGTLGAWFSLHAPMLVELDPHADLEAAAVVVRDAWRVARRTGHRRDLAARVAGRRGPDLDGVLLARVDDASRFTPPREAIVTCAFDSSDVRWWAPPAVLGPLERGFATLLAQGAGGGPMGTIALLSPSDRARVEAINAPPTAPSPLRLSDVVLARAAATPAAAALSLEDRPIPFSAFEARVNRLARHLQSLGIGRGDRVAILLDDAGAQQVGVLAALAAGALAIPLDPEARGSHLVQMQHEAGADAAITRAGLRSRLSVPGAVICVDSEQAFIQAWPADPVPCPAEAEDGACLLFGEGQSRGVVLTHQALVGLFAGVDEVIEERPGVWLGLSPAAEAAAVVDGLWALSRGFELAPTEPIGDRRVAVSLACASSDALVLASVARFADRHGFEAFWMLDWGVAGATLPDAAVAAAAAAVGTERVALRAVTQVGPEPSRMLEIWSMINGLAAGRLGLAVRPETMRRLPAAVSHLRTVGGGESPPALWAVADDAEGFAEAGRVGAGVLVVITPTLLETLPAWVARYRAGRADAGLVGRGQVTLLVPTLIGDDDHTVRAWARGPLAHWLQRQGIREAVPLDVVALCGAGPRAAEWLVAVQGAGVDEVACLVDFGVPPALIRTHLNGLLTLLKPLNEASALPERLVRRGVTHLEVPVGRLRRLLAEPNAAAALTGLQHLIITGEPLPADLARAARATVGPGVRITRRYGPPEAGTWCTAHEVVGDEVTVPLGQPVGQARVYVLDNRGEPVPLGAPGELCVGGIDAEVHPARLWTLGDGSWVLRTGLRVRQTLEGSLEPAPAAPPTPTQPPPAISPRAFDGTPLERAAATVVGSVLGLTHPPDATTDLFSRVTEPELLVRLADALGEALHRDVALAALFQHRSIRELVLHLRSEPLEPASGLRGLRKRRRRRDPP